MFVWTASQDAQKALMSCKPTLLMDTIYCVILMLQNLAPAGKRNEAILKREEMIA